jgi:hypothetical protein
MGVTVGRSVASIRRPCDSRTAIESENACQKYRVDDARDSPVNSMQQDDEILSLCHENRIPKNRSDSELIGNLRKRVERKSWRFSGNSPDLAYSS